MKKTLMTLAALSVVTLSGCVAIRAGKAVATLITPKTVMDAGTDVKADLHERVYFAQFKEHSMGFGDDPDACVYDTVMARYVRNWDEVSEQGVVVHQADPDKPIGYGLIAYHEQCPGRPGRDVFLTSSWHLPLFKRANVIEKGDRVDASDYFVQPKADRPKWVPEAIKLIRAQADKNAKAQEFLAHVGADGMPKALPK
ncbi:hypothetical protein [Castellaniella sp. GW247-6E4]|uniref:hypothetical protein n=1 Tax=Castellaniella sp. GW247-6E4 TaxID=3140380 RepID=UPI003314DD02